MADEIPSTTTEMQLEESGNKDEEDPVAFAPDSNGKAIAAVSKEESQEEDVKPIDVLTTWSQGTSVHGIPYALDHDDFLKWKRMLWWAILAAFTAIMIYLVIVLVDDFLQYATDTTTYFTAPYSLPFPEVTVCNANMFQVSRLALAGIVFPQNDQELFNVSQRVGDFFLPRVKTAFNLKEQISRQVWDPIVTPYGLCWQFNTDQHVYYPGNGGGLAFAASLQQEEYQPTTDIAGLMVFIKQPGSVITGQLPFLFVQPGQFTAVLLKMTKYEREREEPWSNCRSQAPTYTQPRCRAECKYDYVANECGCRSLGDNRAHIMEQNLSYCRPTIEEDCPDIANATVFLKDCQCILPPCEEVVFTPQMYSLPFAEQFLKTTEDFLNISTKVVRENVIKVRINYEMMLKETVQETKAQTRAGLLASIGGQMGLWAGISFISVIEVVGELFLLRMVPRLWGDRRLYGIGSKQKTL